ncbi:MAG: hypothetical protein LIO96_12635 [Lachnospiraceae bacterium]|nr:hypothetical protein [Lachnospiraceae bacterium]
MDKKLFEGDIRYQIVHVSISPFKPHASYSKSLRIVYFDGDYKLKVAYPCYKDGGEIKCDYIMKSGKITNDLPTIRYKVLRSEDLHVFEDNWVWITAEFLCEKYIDEIHTTVHPALKLCTRKIFYDGQTYVTLFIPQADHINPAVFRKVIQRFRRGTHLSTIEEEYFFFLEHGKDEYMRKYVWNIPDEADEEITQFVSKSTGYDIRFECETGNANPKTFDFIRVRIPIPTKQTRPDRKEYITANSKKFIDYTLLQIKKNRHFQNFGVPIEYLRPSRITITGSSELEFLFELKSI